MVRQKKVNKEIFKILRKQIKAELTEKLTTWLGFYKWEDTVKILLSNWNGQQMNTVDQLTETKTQAEMSQGTGSGVGKPEVQLMN